MLENHGVTLGAAFALIVIVVLGLYLSRPKEERIDEEMAFSSPSIMPEGWYTRLFDSETNGMWLYTHQNARPEAVKVYWVHRTQVPQLHGSAAPAFEKRGKKIIPIAA